MMGKKILEREKLLKYKFLHRENDKNKFFKRKSDGKKI